MFPTAALVWTRYADLELVAGNRDGVRSAFSRCLLTNRSSELWSTYTRFIKSEADDSAEGVKKLADVYAYTIDNIGNDIHAGPIWQVRRRWQALG